MKRLTLTAMTLVYSSVAMSETHYLKKDESVSELLYNRLKISPIYRGGYLNKVLEYNQLNFEKSKTLPEGKEIKLPGSETFASETAPEVTPDPVADVPVEENHKDNIYSPTPGVLKPYVTLNAMIESMSGDIEPASFSSTYFFPQLKFGFFHDSEKIIHQVEAGASYVTFKKDKYMEGDNALTNGHVFYQILKKQSQFRWGLKISGDSSTMIVSIPDGSGYKLKNPFLLSFGPSFQWQGAKILSELNLLYSPSHEVDKNNDLKNALGAQASGYYPLSEKLQIGAIGSYSQLNVEDTPVRKFTVGGSLRYFF